MPAFSIAPQWRAPSVTHMYRHKNAKIYASPYWRWRNGARNGEPIRTSIALRSWRNPRVSRSRSNLFKLLAARSSNGMTSKSSVMEILKNRDRIIMCPPDAWPAPRRSTHQEEPVQKTMRLPLLAPPRVCSSSLSIRLSVARTASSCACYNGQWTRQSGAGQVPSTVVRMHGPLSAIAPPVPIPKTPSEWQDSGHRTIQVGDRPRVVTGAIRPALTARQRLSDGRAPRGQTAHGV